MQLSKDNIKAYIQKSLFIVLMFIHNYVLYITIPSAQINIFTTHHILPSAGREPAMCARGPPVVVLTKQKQYFKTTDKFKVQNGNLHYPRNGQKL